MEAKTSGVTMNFPKQKISEKEKYKDDKFWFRQCADWMKNYSYFSSTYNEHRISFGEMWELENLHFKSVDPRSYADIFNPTGNPAIAAQLKEVVNYPVELSNFRTLVSETTKRPRKNNVKILNSDYINARNKAKEDEIFQLIQESIEAGKPVEEVNKSLEQREEYYKMSYRDLKEKQYSDLLNYHYNTQRFDILEQKSIYDKILFGEQHVLCDIVNNVPIMTKWDPKYVYFSSGGATNRVQDSDRISLISYMPLSRIFDTWRDELTEDEMSDLESRWSYYLGIGNVILDPNALQAPGAPGVVSNKGINRNVFPLNPDSNMINTDFDGNSLATTQVAGQGVAGDALIYAPVDKQGNVRVMRFFWKGSKEYKKVRKINNDVEEIEYLTSLNFEADDSQYEVIDTAWYSAWYEATCIGDSLLIDMKEWEGNAYTKDNWELCTSPVIGYCQSVNNQKAESMMDRIKFHKMFFNLIKHEQKSAIGTNVGAILNLNFANMPIKMPGWDLDKHLMMLKFSKINIIDPTNPINEGAEKNLLSGHFNTIGGVENWNQIQNIQVYEQILLTLKQEIDEITGVSAIRKGQNSDISTVGGTERNMAQSAMITEIFYKENDDFWAYAYNNFINLCQVAYKGKKPKFFNATDDISASLYDFDTEEFVNFDLGVIVADNTEEEQIKKELQQFAGNAITNGQMTALEYVRIRRAKSLSEVEAVLEASRKQREQEAQAQQKAQEEQALKIQQAQTEMQAQQQQFLMDLEELRVDMRLDAERIKAESVIEVATIKQEGDSNNNGIADSVEMQKIQAQREIALRDSEIKREDIYKKYEVDKLKANKSNTK